MLLTLTFRPLLNYEEARNTFLNLTSMPHSILKFRSSNLGRNLDLDPFPFLRTVRQHTGLKIMETKEAAISGWILQ